MALKYVHSCNILHRDLKTQNIMLSGPQQRTIKLGDFGIAKVLGSGRDLAATVVGTPHYLSPEVCQSRYYDHKSDIWSLGCVLYELCTLKKPFDASNIPGIIYKIMKCNPAPIADTYSDDLKSMVGWLLNVNPDARPSAEDIENTPIVRVRSSFNCVPLCAVVCRVCADVCCCVSLCTVVCVAFLLSAVTLSLSLSFSESKRCCVCALRVPVGVSTDFRLLWCCRPSAALTVLC
jgi:serine/threonine protein kinase